MRDWRAEIRNRLAGAGLEPTREIDIVEEMAQHLEDRHSEHVAKGRSPDEADAAVLAELDATGVLARRLARVSPKERAPDAPGATGSGLASDLRQDLRYAMRGLLRNRGFTAVTLLSLALGVGATTAIFQLIDALVLRPLPVERPEELAAVRIRDRNWGSGRFQGLHSDLSYPIWELIRDQQQAFSGMLAFSDGGQFNLAPRGEMRAARALYVSGDFFRVLGVPAALGRTLTPADDRRGCGDVVAVVSDGFWRRELGADPAAVGRKVTLDGRAFEVVGVTPARFVGPEVGVSFDVAVPLCLEPLIDGANQIIDRRDAWWLTVMGRRKPEWSLARASAHVEAMSQEIFGATVPPRYAPDLAKRYLEYRLAAYPAGTGVSVLREEYETPLYYLLGIAGLLLLLACANLANLLLARATTRGRELAVRLALGASRGRLVRQLMAESLLLAVAGAALGLILAQFLGDLVIALLSRRAEAPIEATPDARVLAFTVGLAGVTCLLFGLMPALRASRTDVGAALKSSAATTTEARSRLGLRRLLVAAQVALSFVLLVSALLFVRSLRNLTTVDMGFRGDGLLVVDLTWPNVPQDRWLALQKPILERLRVTPGIDAAAATAMVPIRGFWNNDVWLDGDEAHSGRSNLNAVSPGYFATMGILLLAGRDFAATDDAGSPRIAIVNQKFARELAGGASPIGRRLHYRPDRASAPRVYEIVGLVGDTKSRDLRDEIRPMVYMDAFQDATGPSVNTFFVRSARPMGEVTETVINTVEATSPDAVIELDPFDRIVRESVTRDRLMATVAGFFGLLAALLATVGLYGVIAFSVARRTQELGIRMALGADRARVARMIVGEGARLIVVGLAVGVGLALAATRVAGSLLYGLAPHDPPTFVLAALAMATVAVLASLLPARRAASVDPMAALRQE